jgi:ribosome-binding protein aMBF1 (putative translation factor)
MTERIILSSGIPLETWYPSTKAGRLKRIAALKRESAVKVPENPDVPPAIRGLPRDIADRELRDLEAEDPAPALLFDGRALQAERDSRGMSLRELGRKISGGIEPHIVKRWETGRATPRDHQVRKIAAVFGISPAALCVPAVRHAAVTTAAKPIENGAGPA